MRVKLMTFRYSATLGGFDDTPLSDFARDKEVIAFRENFYVVNEVPHVTCIRSPSCRMPLSTPLARSLRDQPRARATARPTCSD
ncbi:MAG: hypothetical protein ACKVXR_10260 [Planctomycetota bacterium]